MLQKALLYPTAACSGTPYSATVQLITLAYVEILVF